MKKIFALLLLAAFLFTGCAQTPSSQASVSPTMQPLPSIVTSATIATPKPSAALIAEKPITRYAGDYVVRDDTSLDSMQSKIMITLYQEHATVNTFYTESNSSSSFEMSLKREGDSLLLSSTDEAVAISQISIQPTAQKPLEWWDYDGVSLDKAGEELRILQLIDLGEPNEETNTRLVDYVGWDTGYAGIGGLVGIFSLSMVKQGIPVNDYFAVYAEAQNGFDRVIPFFGILYPPEAQDIHIGIPFGWHPLSVVETPCWDQFLRLDRSGKLADNASAHKDYYERVALPKAKEWLKMADGEDETKTYSELMFAVQSIVDGSLRSGDKETVKEYVMANYK